MEHRLGKAHLGHAEVGDGRAQGGVVDGDADHQAEREQAVDDALAELGLAGELVVQMQRLDVQGQRAEQHVVHLGHGARPGVFEGLAYVEFLEIQACHLPPRETRPFSTDGRWPGGHRINAATGRNGSETMRAMMSETPAGRKA